ncbi:spermidine synthase [Naumannella huperziae]
MTAADDPLVPDGARPGAFTVRVGGASQSYVDPGDPLHLEFEYMQRIADLLDAWAAPLERLRVIHVGGAGMTLARYVAATRPTSPQIVLEPDAELTERVRAELPLPRGSGVKVRAIDGRAGVAAMRAEFADVIINDAFVAGRVPADLTTREYLADVRRVLRAAGVLLINVTDRGPFSYARRVAAGAAELFPRVAITAEPPILRGRRFGNLVIIASGAELPVRVLQRKGASAMFPYRVVHGADAERWINRAKPFTDADPGTSPDLVRELGLR